MQMAHRAGAVLITVAILAAAAAMWLTTGAASILRGWSAAWVGLVLVQFLLGACTIWTNKAADIATAHVAVGALTLVLGALLTAMSWRLQSRAELAKKGRCVNPGTASLPRTGEPSLDAPPPPVAHELSLASDLSELTKARLTVMVLLTTLAGYCLAIAARSVGARCCTRLLGTALVAICSSIINQALERDTDALMTRTRTRPFVTRRLPLRETIVAGCVLGAHRSRRVGVVRQRPHRAALRAHAHYLRVHLHAAQRASRKSIRWSARSPARCRR